MRLRFWTRHAASPEISDMIARGSVGENLGGIEVANAAADVNPNMIGLAYDAVPLALRTYNQDGLATLHNTDFAREPDFERAYAAALKTDSWGGGHIHWRAHVVCWAASMAADLPGDFVECGTNRGGTAMLMVVYLGERLLAKRLLLFDTFSGLDAKVSTADEMIRLQGHYTDCHQEVVERFAPFPNVEVIQGSVPEILVGRVPEKIAFLHIDLNAAGPERAAIEYLWPRLTPGAVVLLDDYAWTACVEQKHVLDEFATLNEVRILSLPTGQGLMIKPSRID